MKSLYILSILLVLVHCDVVIGGDDFITLASNLGRMIGCSFYNETVSCFYYYCYYYKHNFLRMVLLLVGKKFTLLSMVAPHGMLLKKLVVLRLRGTKTFVFLETTLLWLVMVTLVLFQDPVTHRVFCFSSRFTIF